MRKSRLILLELVLLVLIIILTFLLHLSHNKSRNSCCSRDSEISPTKRSNSVSVVAMFYNEGPFLLEWIAHHANMGVEKFYLYNHGSDDHYLEVLKPMIVSGLVVFMNSSEALQGTEYEISYIMKHKVLAQIACIRHWYNLWSKTTDWVISIDIDEFLWCIDCEKLTKIQKILSNKKYRTAAGISISRIPFSTNGRVNFIKPIELQVMTFFERKKPSELGREAPKILFRTKYRTASFSHLHAFRGSFGPLMNLAGQKNGSDSGICENCTVERVERSFVILHYLAGSLASCRMKRQRSSLFSGGWRHLMHPKYCERLHRNSLHFDRNNYVNDTTLETNMRLYLNTLCNQMHSLNTDYYSEHKCCSSYKN